MTQSNVYSYSMSAVKMCDKYMTELDPINSQNTYLQIEYV